MMMMMRNVQDSVTVVVAVSGAYNKVKGQPCILCAVIESFFRPYCATKKRNLCTAERVTFEIGMRENFHKIVVSVKRV